MALPQRFTVSLDGTLYRMVVKWNQQSECWILDIYNDAGAAINQGIPLVTGADLLGQFEYMLLGGALVAQTDGAPFTPPTFENFGSLGRLYFVVPPA